MNWRHILIDSAATFLDTLLALPALATVGALSGHVNVTVLVEWGQLLLDGVAIAFVPACWTFLRNVAAGLKQLDT